MKITINYKAPSPPPIESFTVEFSLDQLRFIKYLAADRDGSAAARSLYNKLASIAELPTRVNYNVEF